MAGERVLGRFIVRRYSICPHFLFFAIGADESRIGDFHEPCHFKDGKAQNIRDLQAQWRVETQVCKNPID